VEIAVGHERQAFQADVVEDVVAVGDFPGVQQRGEFLLVFPEVERVLAPLAFHDVRVRGHGERAQAAAAVQAQGFSGVGGKTNRPAFGREQSNSTGRDHLVGAR